MESNLKSIHVFLVSLLKSTHNHTSHKHMHLCKRTIWVKPKDVVPKIKWPYWLREFSWTYKVYSRLWKDEVALLRHCFWPHLVGLNFQVKKILVIWSTNLKALGVFMSPKVRCLKSHEFWTWILRKTDLSLLWVEDGMYINLVLSISRQQFLRFYIHSMGWARTTITLWMGPNT